MASLAGFETNKNGRVRVQLCEGPHAGSGRTNRVNSGVLVSGVVGSVVSTGGGYLEEQRALPRGEEIR